MNSGSSQLFDECVRLSGIQNAFRKEIMYHELFEYISQVSSRVGSLLEIWYFCVLISHRYSELLKSTK